LTGFGPFPGVAANASALLVPEVAQTARARHPSVRFHVEILATEWRQAPDRAAALIRDLRPALALHFGVSGRARALNLETRARNMTRAACDAAGELPAASYVLPKAPDILTTELPFKHIAERLRAQGIPAHTSRDAGAYLCNAVLYRSLIEARGSDVPALVGFVHLPARLARRRGSVRPGLLGWEQAVEGSLEIIGAGLGQVRPSRRRDLFDRWDQPGIA
jgi:pyroglutamyl-peptidase